MLTFWIDSSFKDKNNLQTILNLDKKTSFIGIFFMYIVQDGKSNEGLEYKFIVLYITIQQRSRSTN